MSEERPIYGAQSHLPKTIRAFSKLACALPPNDPEYREPEPQEINHLIALAGWSKGDVAKILNISYNPKKGSTTLRKWIADKSKSEHRQIPYSAWHLLLLYAGVVEIEDFKHRLLKVD